MTEQTTPRQNNRAAEEKRLQILRAAWEQIRLYGFAKTTVDEIAAAAGIGKGTVYLYFRSKEEILLALVERTNWRVLSKLKAIASSSKAPGEKLKEIVLSRALDIFDIIRSSPHGEDVIRSFKPAIVKSLGWFFQEQKKLIVQIVQEGGERGDFRERKPQEVAEALTTLSELLTPPYYKFRSKRELRNFVTTLMDRFVAGL